MIETSERTVGRGGLILPDLEQLEQSLDQEFTAIHLVRQWFLDLVKQNSAPGSDTPQQIIIPSNDEKKIVVVGHTVDTTSARQLTDRHGRGEATVRGTDELAISMLNEGAFVPEPVMLITKTLSRQTGMVGLYTMLPDDTTCSLLAGNEWVALRGRDIQNRSFYDSAEYQKSVDQQIELANTALHDFIEYVA